MQCNKWLCRAKFMVNKLVLPNGFQIRRRLAQDHQAVKFDMKYSLRVYNKDYKELKPLEKIDNGSSYAEPVFIFPGFEGRASLLEPLINNLNRVAYCFQYPFEAARPTASLLVDSLFPELKKYIHRGEKINILAHSFGGIIAMETIHRLQSENYDNIRLCLLESSPYAMKCLAIDTIDHCKDSETYDAAYLTAFLRALNIDPEQYRLLVNIPEPWPIKLDNFMKILPDYPPLSKEEVRVAVNGFYQTMQTILSYEENRPKLTSKTTLIKSLVKILPIDDYQMAKYFDKPVDILHTQGHHFNMIKYQETADLINRVFES